MFGLPEMDAATAWKAWNVHSAHAELRGPSIQVLALKIGSRVELHGSCWVCIESLKRADDGLPVWLFGPGSCPRSVDNPEGV